MRKPKPLYLAVGAFYFLVTERAGLLRAHMNGLFGWDSVWAENRTDLALRVKAALRGGQ